jgi:tetratricopeptide (TPR) repeat protein
VGGDGSVPPGQDDDDNGGSARGDVPLPPATESHAPLSAGDLQHLRHVGTAARTQGGIVRCRICAEEVGPGGCGSAMMLRLDCACTSDGPCSPTSSSPVASRSAYAHISCLVERARSCGDGSRGWTACLDCGTLWGGEVQQALAHAHWRLVRHRPSVDRERLFALGEFARALTSAGKLEEALPLRRESLEIRRRTFGDSDLDTLTAINNLALLYARLGRYQGTDAGRGEEATKPLPPKAAAARAAVARAAAAAAAAAAGPAHEGDVVDDGKERTPPSDGLAVTAAAAAAAGRGGGCACGGAARSPPQPPSSVQEVVGPGRGGGGGGGAGPAGEASAGAKADGALPLAQEVVERMRGSLGAEHPATIAACSTLGRIHMEMGDYARAQPLLEGVLRAQQRGANAAGGTTAVHHPSAGAGDGGCQVSEGAASAAAAAAAGVGHSLAALGELHEGLGELGRAQSRLEQALASQRASMGSDHPTTLSTICALGALLLRRGDVSGAAFALLAEGARCVPLPTASTRVWPA